MIDEVGVGVGVGVGKIWVALVALAVELIVLAWFVGRNCGSWPVRRSLSGRPLARKVGQATGVATLPTFALRLERGTRDRLGVPVRDDRPNLRWRHAGL